MARLGEALNIGVPKDAVRLRRGVFAVLLSGSWLLPPLVFSPFGFLMLAVIVAGLEIGPIPIDVVLVFGGLLHLISRLGWRFYVVGSQFIVTWWGTAWLRVDLSRTRGVRVMQILGVTPYVGVLELVDAAVIYRRFRRTYAGSVFVWQVNPILKRRESLVCCDRSADPTGSIAARNRLIARQATSDEAANLRWRT